ncbi:MAG: hypothetical protein P1P82_07305 [Bacteroidales bacterium]|nr:hypothetical protein [Bacteroidales bacterium]MDT8431471.1 hypothetical protein [Bacteroidales bacterium]
MSKIIYIAGLGHSGSTLLDMSLGTLPGVIGLGELKTILDDRTRSNHYTSFCSCGKKAAECEIWSRVPDLFSGISSRVERIEAIHALLEKSYGRPIVMVDASKNSYSYLGELLRTHDVKVIFLTRDVRSWSYSRHLSTGRPVVYFVLRWVLENHKLRRRFRKMGIDPMWTGYEELSLYPELLMQKISDFCGLTYAHSMLHPDNTNSHIFSGNVARADPEKRSGWKYDARWMLSGRILLLSPLIVSLLRLHKKYVYSNVLHGAMKHFYLFGTARKKELDKKFN